MNLKRIIRGLKRRVKEIQFKYYKAHNLKKYADCLFFNTFGYNINWDAPRDLNEWINWLAFNTDTTEWSNLADKYKVRDYVKEKGLSDILIPLYGVWNNPDEIDFDALPQSFVLKCNNGSGDVIIVENKDKIDKRKIINDLNKSMNSKFGKESAEPHYLRISPKIIAEALLDKKNQEVISSSLIDYKFWCFNGEVILCWVDWNRDNVNHKLVVQIYDQKWKICPHFFNPYNGFIFQVESTHCPVKWHEMLEVACKLSKGFPQVRVDLYQVGERIYFGEMTFTSQCGRMPYFSKEAQLIWGECCLKAAHDLGMR